MQQRLWPDPQPLVERLGRDFFRGLPPTPGVYLMHGAGEVVLYVGKARNLRHRLGSYRVANPERLPRRTLRLLRLVERIAWEECDDESGALRRESELLLALKPRFNRAGVWRGAERFLAWRSQPAGLELAVAESEAEGWSCVGPLGARAVYLHRALIRLLWCRLQPARGFAGMPAGWFEGAHGPQVLIPQSDPAAVGAAADCLARLAGGQCQEFEEWLLPPATPFEQKPRAEDWQLVSETFVRRTRTKAIDEAAS